MGSKRAGRRYTLTSLTEQLGMRGDTGKALARLICSPRASSPVAPIRERNTGLDRPLLALPRTAFFPLNSNSE